MVKSGTQALAVCGLFLTACVYAASTEPIQSDREPVSALEFRIVGKVSAVDVRAGTVTVATSKGGAQVVVTTNMSTTIVRNGTSCSLADAQIGDRALALVNRRTKIASRVECSGS